MAQNKQKLLFYNNCNFPLTTSPRSSSSSSKSSSSSILIYTIQPYISLQLQTTRKPMKAICQRVLLLHPNLGSAPIISNKFVSALLRNTNTMSGSDQDSPFDSPRLVVKKVLARQQKEGEGATVRRSIGRS